MSLCPLASIMCAGVTLVADRQLTSQQLIANAKRAIERATKLAEDNRELRRTLRAIKQQLREERARTRTISKTVTYHRGPKAA